MTAVLPGRTAATGAGVWTIGAPRLLAGLDRFDHLDAAAHLDVHGPLPAVGGQRLLAALEATPILGRGGAGFPLGRKLAAVRGRRRRVIVNGSESEPASRKDRTLLRRTPHLVLDGALTAAELIGADSVTVAVHDATAEAAVRRAIRERRERRAVHVHRLTGGFVGGEARAVVRALVGGPALPPGRRRQPTDDGNVVSNAETFAQLAMLVRLGPAGFAATGTSAEPGTALLTVGGAVGRPGVAEVPLGTPLGIVLGAARAADPRYVVTGGFHGSWLLPDPALRLCRAELAAAGGSFGAGVLLVLDGATCPLGELARVTAWLAAQSARQCGPCAFGLPALAADVAALAAGHPSAGAHALRHAALAEGRGACSHPDAAARFVRSGLHLLEPDVRTHLAARTCGRPVLGRLLEEDR